MIWIYYWCIQHHYVYVHLWFSYGQRMAHSSLNYTYIGLIEGEWEDDVGIVHLHLMMMAVELQYCPRHVSYLNCKPACTAELWKWRDRHQLPHNRKIQMGRLLVRLLWCRWNGGLRFSKGVCLGWEPLKPAKWWNLLFMTLDLQVPEQTAFSLQFVFHMLDSNVWCYVHVKLKATSSASATF